jgi:hypothetical protein
MNPRIIVFTYKGKEWLWNSFQGFFFQPVKWPERKRERIVKHGHLYDQLREASGYL